MKIPVGSVIRYVKARNSYDGLPLHPTIKLDPNFINYSSYLSMLRTATN